MDIYSLISIYSTLFQYFEIALNSLNILFILNLTNLICGYFLPC
jgi:hypothetical protein